MALKRIAWQHRVYRLVWLALAPGLVIWFWWRGRKEPAYRQRITERLGWIPVIPSNAGCLWIHAASVGEVNAAQPLLEQLLERWPSHAVVVSTQTPTGADALAARWGKTLRHVYAPLDSPWAVRRFLERLQPQGLILIEREVWPEWLYQCARLVIPVTLVNARMGAASHQVYERWFGWMRAAWSNLTVAAADTASAQRLISLGATSEKTTVTGNLKFDVRLPDAQAARVPPPAGRRLVVAGSTHAEDENAWLEAWPGIAERHPDALLVLVPRHPQRFAEVADHLRKLNFAFSRSSETASVKDSMSILLVDEMGQLAHWYRSASFCFIGGTLAPVGGHNPLEALNAGQAILFGPHTHNAQILFDDILSHNAGECVRDSRSLRDKSLEWLANPAPLAKRRMAVNEWVSQHRGATQRTLQALAPWLNTIDPNNLRVIESSVEGVHTCWFDAMGMPQATAADFLPDRHVAQIALATGSGRGQALKVVRLNKPLVIRHYFRGGLMAKLSKDRFWPSAIHNSRGMREFTLLRLMNSWSLPVPTPAGAHHHRSVLGDRADIAIGWIPDANNLIQRLQSGPIPETEWRTVGKTIRAMHDRQVFHSDLNAHNLMLDVRGKAWIVDFDKCMVKPDGEWKHRNLSRLLRSLQKELSLRPNLHWQLADWEFLLSGYHSH